MMTKFVLGPATGDRGPFAQVTAVTETEARRRVQSVNSERDWTDRGTVRAWMIINADFDLARVKIANSIQWLI